MRFRTSLTATGVAALVAAGVAGATIPGADGRIGGCYNDTNGSLRVTESPKDCRNHETPISWNTEGQPGPQGERGPAGPAGPAAPGAMPQAVRISGGGPIGSTPNGTLVSFGQEEMGAGGLFSTDEPDRVTIKRDGFYQLNVSLAFAGGDRHTMYLTRNSGFGLLTDVSNGETYSNASTMAYLRAGDYVELRVSHDAPEPKNGSWGLNLVWVSDFS